MDNDKSDSAESSDILSDIGRWGLIAGAVMLPLMRGDRRSAGTSALAILLASLASKGLKSEFDRWRPDGDNDNSFPSQHTADTFAAASALHRCGSGGVVPFILASLISVGRVSAKEHYIGDVAAGFGIGISSAKPADTLVRRSRLAAS